MDEEVEGLDLELATSDSVRFGMLLVGVSVLWGLLLALLPPAQRTPNVIVTFLIPLLVAWELGVITTYTLLQYRERVFGRLVDASTYLAAGIMLTVIDFSLIGFFFMFREAFLGPLAGTEELVYLFVILIGVAGYYAIYRSVRLLMATTR